MLAWPLTEDQEAHEVAEESSDEESEEEDEGSDAEEGLIAATSGSNAFSKPQLSFISPVTWLEVSVPCLAVARS